jgi:hypothetical protein
MNKRQILEGVYRRGPTRVETDLYEREMGTVEVIQRVLKTTKPAPVMGKVIFEEEEQDDESK